MIREKYRLNIRRLALLTLPTFYRKPLMGGILYSAVRPLRRIYQEFLTTIERSEIELRSTGQVCRLRGVLNELLDPDERGIRIVEDDSGDGTLKSYCRSEERWVMLSCRSQLGGISITRRGYGGVNGYDFRLEVPERLRGSETRLRAIVDRYKLASKRYGVSYY